MDNQTNVAPKTTVTPKVVDVEIVGIRFADFYFFIGVMVVFTVLLIVMCVSSIAATRLFYRKRTKELVDEEKERQQRQEKAWRECEERVKLELERNKIENGKRISPPLPPTPVQKVCCSPNDHCHQSSMVSSCYSRSRETIRKPKSKQKQSNFSAEPKSSPSVSPNLPMQPPPMPHTYGSPQYPYDPNNFQTYYVPQPYPTYMPQTQYMTVPTVPHYNYYPQYPPTIYPPIPQQQSDKT